MLSICDVVEPALCGLLTAPQEFRAPEAQWLISIGNFAVMMPGTVMLTAERLNNSNSIHTAAFGPSVCELAYASQAENLFRRLAL